MAFVTNQILTCFTALIYASKNGHFEIAKLFLDLQMFLRIP